MKNNSQNQNREITQIQANSADEYWTKKYGVSTDELKAKSHRMSITDKILEVAAKNKTFSY
ncbi:MAG: hypothetical protein ACTHMI_08335 [Mucilaginibacter sp.]|uniref:hypothetical protein n=1 Tax=Mucilaginibacter sp. L3T2-6 TaxID=3062491 RepID=UPI00267460CF|nr:hypothetical protein [Mucilaginibacter sp. L3T2-6]MDO3644315.1 hypothetical protein [Mucilaginibacter sp. L3T2-6]MDV6216766.1 hypothetical protein [Mucilaginibacter sp. L3T2-6]